MMLAPAAAIFGPPRPSISIDRSSDLRLRISSAACGPALASATVMRMRLPQRRKSTGRDGGCQATVEAGGVLRAAPQPLSIARPMQLRRGLPRSPELDEHL